MPDIRSCLESKRGMKQRLGNNAKANQRDRRVTKSLYLSLPVAELVDRKSTEFGVSANKLINLLVVTGLNDEEILKTAVMEKLLPLPQQ